MTFKVALTIAAVLAASLTAINAQDRPAQDRPVIGADPKACAPGDRLQAGERGATAPSTTTGESLSDKLARTDGVICPPVVDPGIRAPTPDAGTIVIIPPPGSPGGDPTVRPK